VSQGKKRPVEVGSFELDGGKKKGEGTVHESESAKLKKG